MGVYRITYRSRSAWPRAPLVLDVVADELEEHRDVLTLWVNVMVLCWPRRVVAQRVHRRDVAAVEILCRCGPRSPS